MLAPRKTLWSTPLTVVDHLLEWIPLQDNDKVCDIGCGDGRILLEWARRISASPEPIPKVSFVGVDIDMDRIQQCEQALEKAMQDRTIHGNISISFFCGNALESSHLYQHATIFFLYLIPRGLKMIHPLLLEHKMSMGNQPLHIVSYMAKLPGEKVTDRALLQVEHQPGAEWPCYYYKM